MLIIDNYVHRLIDITGIYDSSSFFAMCKENLFNILSVVKSHEIKGIIVGCFFHDGKETHPVKNKQGLFLSTGMEAKQFPCLERDIVIKELEKLYETRCKEVVFIRAPFISSKHSFIEFQS